LGGGITVDNAAYWLENGASDVIVTSYLFSNGVVHEDRLQRLAESVGKDRLVIDLSCRLKDGQYWVVTERWQHFTNIAICTHSMDYFANYCHEFLIHAVDVEGKCSGIEEQLVEILGNWGKVPITYAGGIASQGDLDVIKQKGKNMLDFTVGSALDIFGGSKLRYQDMLHYS
jgi:phosphoribosylformimino-5-aminoimidazole carboxamide ribotide isomerase